MPLKPAKRAAEPTQQLPAKRPRVPTRKLLEGDGTASQPIELPETQQSSPSPPPNTPPSPLPNTPPIEVLGGASEPVDIVWESQLLLHQLSNAVEVPASSIAATEASNAANNDSNEVPRLDDDYANFDWARHPGLMKPAATTRHKRSWIFNHGYRLAAVGNYNKTYFVCKYCHQQRKLGGIFQVTRSTSAAIAHLALPILHHRLNKNGLIVTVPQLSSGQTSLRFAVANGLPITQSVGNQLGNFNIQSFRLAAVRWLIDNNYPLREFETPAFRELLRQANPEAEAALWRSHNSVSTFVMKLYSWLQPQVVSSLAQACSKVHISFDGWTTKGGKRGFFGVVAHYTEAAGNVVDLPIALPQLTGAHTGDRIAEVVAQTLADFEISRTKLGYFVLDNAYANDRAVTKLATMYDFVASDRRLRCACHILNLIGQTVMFGRDSDAYNNTPEHVKEEEFYMQEWRKDGPLGVFLSVINHINTLKQYKLFYSCQRQTLAELPTHSVKILEPVKPVVTRWNSYCSAFERGIEL